MFNQWLKPPICLFLGYGLSVVLIVGYVNMFPLWKFLSSIWAQEVFVFLPIMMSIGAIAVLGIIFKRRQRGARLFAHKISLAAGVLFCFLALIIPDPQFPVKRVHVAEYILLSFIIRFVMSFRMQGLPLLFFSAAFSSVLGIHDELLQGFHLARTYGFRDIAVNSLASLGGAVIWDQLGLFSRDLKSPAGKMEVSEYRSFLYVFCLITSVLMFILPLALYRGSRLPFWPAMPLTGTIVYFSLYFHRFNSSWMHGVAALSFASFALICYPVVNSFKVFSFY